MKVNYKRFYELNGIDYSDTRIVLKSDGDEAKNESYEIPWETPSEKDNLLEAKANALIKRFEVNDKTEFLKKFTEAINGDGSELRRITTLHSSALLALMCFWRVDENHPISIEQVEYTKVFFECRNRVINGRGPSNIDIALVSKDKKTVLLLESKFTELYNCKSVTVAESYKPFYDELAKLWGDNIEIKKAPEKGFELTQTEERSYLGGIKQMVSHIIGAIRGPKKSKTHEEYQRAFENASEIVLGTILYQPSGEEFSGKCANYAKLYEKCIGGDIGKKIVSAFSRVLNKEKDEVKNIKILGKPLYYQDVFTSKNRDLLLEKVKDTYFS